MESILTCAMSLASQGRAVFPCWDNKAPACPDGFKNATRDPETIRTLWRRYPAPLIGIATGTPSGIAVLDIDAKHEAARKWWREHRDLLPDTFTVRTRSGGLHLWFRQLEGLRCTVSRIAIGCDTRADGGYVIAWHAAGFPVLRNAPLAPWPDWLAHVPSPTPYPRPEQPTVAAGLSGTPPRRYAESALRNAVARVASSAEGSRNHALNREAFALMRFVPDGLAPAEIADALAIAARHAGLPPRETASTLASALRAGGAR